MTMFRAGMAVALVFMGGIAAFLGGVVLSSALTTGTLTMSYGTGARATTEVLSQVADPSRFMQMTLLLGAGPLVLGSLAAWWGWRTLKR
jgi:hypothetical protein